jgi:hypothetical protein
MALGGAFQDRFLDLFNDNLMMELQQEGSRLGNIFRTEAMKGQKAYFDKIGTSTAQQKTSRLQKLTFQEETYERRLLTFNTYFAAHAPDINDLMDMVADPTSDLIKNMGFTLGRERDAMIMDALLGNVAVQKAGVVANVAIPAGQKVAVSYITYDQDETAGDKGLTPGKLMRATQLMKENFVGAMDLVVISPAGQLANLMAYSRASSGDFRTTRPLESGALEPALNGYLGFNFVNYEETGLDSNNDENVVVVARSALKIGERMPLTTKIAPIPDMVGHPQGIHALFDAGAARMYEEAVVVIACDPRKS